MKNSSLYRFTLLISMLFSISFCTNELPVNCIDKAKIEEGPCTYEYAPVCGCDGKTYGNACAAERSGVTSWSSGTCEENGR